MKVALVVFVILTAVLISTKLKSEKKNPLVRLDHVRKLSGGGVEEDEYVTWPEGEPIADSEQMVKCECALFDAASTRQNRTPILTQTAAYVECDHGGHQQCLNHCSVFVRAAIHRGPQLLCAKLRNYNMLKVSIYSRACNTQTWTYTGLTSHTTICCYKRRVVDCRNW